MDASQKTYKLLIINPGSTSTKVSLYENERSLFEKSLFHDAPVLLQYPHVNDQIPFRYQVILDMLKAEGVDPADIDVFVGRGGSACTQPGGVTRIDQKLYDDTVAAVGGSEHPAKLGVMLAWKFALEYGRDAYTLNPTNVDEYGDYARLTGIRGVYRVSHSHVLNQKAVAEAHAERMGRRYEDCNFIVGHIDGGITVSAHDHGRMVDGNMGADGEGAFTPTRIGSVPVLALLDYIESHSIEDVRLKCSRAGGFDPRAGGAGRQKGRAGVEHDDLPDLQDDRRDERRALRPGGRHTAHRRVDALRRHHRGHTKALRLDRADIRVPRRDGAGGAGAVRAQGAAGPGHSHDLQRQKRMAGL